MENSQLSSSITARPAKIVQFPLILGHFIPHFLILFTGAFIKMSASYWTLFKAFIFFGQSTLIFLH